MLLIPLALIFTAVAAILLYHYRTSGPPRDRTTAVLLALWLALGLLLALALLVTARIFPD